MKHSGSSRLVIILINNLHVTGGGVLKVQAPTRLIDGVFLVSGFTFKTTFAMTNVSKAHVLELGSEVLVVRKMMPYIKKMFI